MGGAGAIGALAYGVPSLGLDPVDLITGPGNVYVAAAKRLVRGVVGIDAEAGPTEIVVIADRDRRSAPDRRRPGEPGRARRARRRRAGHRFARTWPRPSSRRSMRSPTATRHGDRVREALDGAPVGDRAGRRHRRRRGVQQRVRPRAPRAAHRGAGRDARPHRERRRHLPRRRRPGQPGRLPRRLEPRAADRRPGAVRVGPRRGDVPAIAADHPLRPHRPRGGARRHPGAQRRRAAARPRRRGGCPVPGP